MLWNRKHGTKLGYRAENSSYVKSAIICINVIVTEVFEGLE